MQAAILVPRTNLAQLRPPPKESGNIGNSMADGAWSALSCPAVQGKPLLAVTSR
jgi:hypothetical protein